LAQKTAWSAAALTESDINTYLMHEGGAWTTWTPTLTQSGSVTVTVTRATYARSGRKIEFHAQLSVTGSGTGSNAILMSLPVTAASSNHPINGTGAVTDTSASQNSSGIAYLNSTTTVGIQPAGVGLGYGLLGFVGFTAALTSGDLIHINGTYEAAS
jgi:hypothetical protein